jgi:hypothetical protein
MLGYVRSCQVSVLHVTSIQIRLVHVRSCEIMLHLVRTGYARLIDVITG